MNTENAVVASALDQRIDNLEQFWFLADAPMFVDGEQIERLYDAIFRPEMELASRSDSGTGEFATKVVNAAKGGVEVQAKVPPALAFFGLDFGGKASLEGSTSGEEGTRRAETDTSTYVAIKSSERRLERLISLYANKYQDRIFWVNSTLLGGSSLKEPKKPRTWQELEEVLEKPGARPLIVIDFEEGTKLMPMYAELKSGKNSELVKDYLAKRAKKNEEEYPIPKYPQGNLSPEKEATERRDYWQKIFDRFESHEVLRTIEDASSTVSERFEWIDFRALIDMSKSSEITQPPHLHFVARGMYPAGTFAYQLVRRAKRYGVRVVGTLKKGQDINVLAVYER